MQLIEAPRLVDCIVAAIATSPLGEVGAVVVARDVERKYLMIVDALIGSFSDFDGFCETLYDRIDDLAGTIRSRASPVVFCEPDLFERCGRHSRLDTRFFPPDAERDPARRAVMLAAGDDTVRLAATMARKILIHPFDQLASARYDPGASNVLADALGRAFDVTMISNAERNRARHRRGS
jgi:hypothetical protein